VTEQARTITVTVTGAVIGGVAGYLFFTENGRALRRQLEPMVDDIVRELDGFRRTIEKAAGVANEGWRMLSDAMSEARPHQGNVHQTSPF
jgi:hypothetical protein